MRSVSYTTPKYTISLNCPRSKQLNQHADVASFTAQQKLVLEPVRDLYSSDNLEFGGIRKNIVTSLTGLALVGWCGVKGAQLRQGGAWNTSTVPTAQIVTTEKNIDFTGSNLLTILAEDKSLLSNTITEAYDSDVALRHSTCIHLTNTMFSEFKSMLNARSTDDRAHNIHEESISPDFQKALQDFTNDYSNPSPKDCDAMMDFLQKNTQASNAASFYTKLLNHFLPKYYERYAGPAQFNRDIKILQNWIDDAQKKHRNEDITNTLLDPTGGLWKDDKSKALLHALGPYWWPLISGVGFLALTKFGIVIWGAKGIAKGTIILVKGVSSSISDRLSASQSSNKSKKSKKQPASVVVPQKNTGNSGSSASGYPVKQSTSTKKSKPTKHIPPAQKTTSLYNKLVKTANIVVWQEKGTNRLFVGDSEENLNDCFDGRGLQGYTSYATAGKIPVVFQNQQGFFMFDQDRNRYPIPFDKVQGLIDHDIIRPLQRKSPTEILTEELLREPPHGDISDIVVKRQVGSDKLFIRVEDGKLLSCYTGPAPKDYTICAVNLSDIPIVFYSIDSGRLYMFSNKDRFRITFDGVKKLAQQRAVKILQPPILSGDTIIRPSKIGTVMIGHDDHGNYFYTYEGVKIYYRAGQPDVGYEGILRESSRSQNFILFRNKMNPDDAYVLAKNKRRQQIKIPIPTLRAWGY